MENESGLGREPTELESQYYHLVKLVGGFYKEFAEHLKKNHQGKPASSCHRCMNCQQKIMFGEHALVQIRKLIELENNDSI